MIHSVIPFGNFKHWRVRTLTLYSLSYTHSVAVEPSKVGIFFRAPEVPLKKHLKDPVSESPFTDPLDFFLLLKIQKIRRHSTFFYFNHIIVKNIVTRVTLKLLTPPLPERKRQISSSTRDSIILSCPLWGGVEFFPNPFEPRPEERKKVNCWKELQRRPHTIINFLQVKAAIPCVLSLNFETRENSRWMGD